MSKKSHIDLQLIIRNPNQSSNHSSNNSSHFHQLPKIQIQSQQNYQCSQYQSNDLPQFHHYPETNHQSFQFNHQTNKNIKHMDNQSQFKKTQTNNINQKGTEVNNIKPQRQLKCNKKQNHYRYGPQRLTFENHSVSPFIFFKPTPSQNLNQQQSMNHQTLQQSMRHLIQQQPMRHSFNPLQNKITQLQTLCKQLLQISLQQQHLFYQSKNSMQIIQSKINYVIGLLNSHHHNTDKTISSTNEHTRESISNQNQFSRPFQNTSKTNSNFINSSQQLSRYLEPLSSQQKYPPAFQPNQLYHNQSIHKNQLSKVNPFILNSQFCHQSIHQEDDSEDKQNRNQSNFYPIKYVKNIKKIENGKVHINTKKSKNLSNTEDNFQTRGKTTKGRKNGENKKVRTLSLVNAIEIEKNKQHFGNETKIDLNYDNQSNLHKTNWINLNKSIIQSKNQKKIPKVRIGKINENFKTNQSMDLENSQIFNSVDLPNSIFNGKSSIRQCQSTDLPRKNKKTTVVNHQKTLLQCIEERRMLIDQQLSKRLMRNAPLMCTDRNNQSIKTKKYQTIYQ